MRPVPRVAGHPGLRSVILRDVFTVLTAWLAVLACCVAALVLGQGARTAPRAASPSRVPAATRLGLAVSMSGPWVAVLVCLLVAAVTGAWLVTAVVALAAVLATAVVGLVLAPL